MSIFSSIPARIQAPYRYQCNDIPDPQTMIEDDMWGDSSGIVPQLDRFSESAGMFHSYPLVPQMTLLPAVDWHHGIDELELRCQRLALTTFYQNPKEWGVNVRPSSGNTANLAAMGAILQPQDRILTFPISNDRNYAGHAYESGGPHFIVPANGRVDYEHLASQVESFKPHLIMCGTSVYPRDWDYSTIRAIADSVGAWVVADISHFSGLIAAQELSNPFQHCDIVTTSTEGSLRGPRGGLIFFRRNHPKARDLDQRISKSVFSCSPDAPHSQTITAIATALERVRKREWRVYAKQVIRSARVLANALQVYGYKLLTGGTDTDLLVWDLRPQKLAGSKLQALGDIVGLTLDVVRIPGETALHSPHGVCLRIPLLTTRHMKEKDIHVVAAFLHRTMELCVRIQKAAGSRLLEDFTSVAAHRKGSTFREVERLARDIRHFTAKRPLLGLGIKK